MPGAQAHSGPRGCHHVTAAGEHLVGGAGHQTKRTHDATRTKGSCAGDRPVLEELGSAFIAAPRAAGRARSSTDGRRREGIIG